MKKRIALISVLGTIFLLCICLGVASLFLIKDIAYASEVVFLTDSDETSSAMQNIVAGEQIELYLGVNDKSLPNEIEEGGTTYSLQSFKIADESIVKVEGTSHTLVPLKYGLTYASCEYSNGKTYNYNIIVHNDTEFVKDVTISGKSVSQTDFYVGETYQLDLKVSSDCDFAQVKVSVKTDYEVDRLDEHGNVKKDNIDAEEFIEINGEGELKVVGVGQCFVHIQSATNRNDPGVSFTVNSEFKDTQIEVAVEEYFTSTGDGGHNQTKYPLENIFTKDDLNGIEKLVFSDMKEIKESELHKVVPNVKDITFSLLNASPTAKTYTLSAGDIKYTIIGLEDKPYGFSIASEGEQIEITLENVVLRSSTTTMQLNVTNATLNIEGKCEFTANGNSNAITAENLVVNLCDASNLAIYGGNGRNGTSSDIGGTDGYNAIHASGALSFIGAHEAMATINIFGGNGGNGAIPEGTGEKGGNGGFGASAVIAETFRCDGAFNLLITGGNGGNGADGTRGADGADGKNGPSGWFWNPKKGDNGEPGSPGGAGGVGGEGGYAIFVKDDLYLSTKVYYVFTGGSGGDGGAGGAGGEGGDGASDTSGNPFNGVGDPGDGGDGGAGGTGGAGGDGQKGVNVGNFAYISGRGGAGGTAGIGGPGGAGGDAGKNGSDGKNGSSGVNGEDGLPGRSWVNNVITEDNLTQSLGLEIVNNVVTGIGTCCDKVIYINMPIAEGAFMDCIQLQMVYLLDGCTSIGNKAFFRCNNLKTIYFMQTETPSIGEDVCGYTWDAADFAICVRCELKDSYVTSGDQYWRSSILYGGKLKIF